MNSQDKFFCDNVSGILLGNPVALYNTFELIEKCIKEKINGDFIEMGVYAGGHPIVMAHVCQKYGDSRPIHMFDSFEGIPKPRENEHEDDYKNYGRSTILETTGVAACSLDGVKEFTKRYGVGNYPFIYHKGWFQNTLPLDAPKIGKIALLRLDVDLYESTKVCLEYLYEKVSLGGYVIDDDYNSPTCFRALDEYLKAHGHIISPIRIPGQETTAWWKRS